MTAFVLLKDWRSMWRCGSAYCGDIQIARDWFQGVRASTANPGDDLPGCLGPHEGLGVLVVAEAVTPDLSPVPSWPLQGEAWLFELPATGPPRHRGGR